MGRRAVVWTYDMIAELKRLRALNTPLFLCAELIGVCQAAVLKARELGIADRRNRGCRYRAIRRTALDQLKAELEVIEAE